MLIISGSVIMANQEDLKNSSSVNEDEKCEMLVLNIFILYVIAII